MGSGLRVTEIWGRVPSGGPGRRLRTPDWSPEADDILVLEHTFLADRTNGRAIATLLRLSSSSSSVVCDVMYCGQTVRSRAKVTMESLYEVVYEKSIGTKMNDLDLCLEVVSRSRQPLHYI